MANAAGVGLNRNTSILILGIVVLLIVAISLFHRSGGFSVVIESVGQRLEFEFEEDRIDLSEILDKILSETGRDDGSNQTRSKVITNILSAHGFYQIPSGEAVTAIRMIKEEEGTQSFVHEIRRILHNLEGPFSRPSTFKEAPDARLLRALEDLNEHEPSSPLVAELWEMSLEWNGVFSPRELPIKIAKDDSLEHRNASTCRGSILLGKSGIILVDENPFIEVNIAKPRLCTPKTSEDLLSGERATVWVSPDDLKELYPGESTPHEIEAVLIPFPSGLTHDNSQS